MTQRIQLSFKTIAQASDIYIGRGILNSFERLLSRHFRRGKVALVGDKRLAAALLKPISASLTSAGWDVSVLLLKAGETVKSLKALEGIYTHLIKTGADRRTPLVAVGGGTIGDAAGFAAATFQRGIPLVQVPTTLLAQVDSAVGGKTAVNHPLSKNAVGAFYQPALTVADSDCLRALPRREFEAGLAEVVKYAQVFDPVFARRLDARWSEISRREPRELLYVVRRSVAWKAKIVAQDELDLAGKRELLNYGHTVGHALEAATDYRGFLHGEAVAWGMRACLELSRGRGWLRDEAELSLMESLLGKLPAPRWPSNLRFHRLLSAMRRDKKVRDSKNVFILLRALGRPVRVNDVGEEELLAALRRLIPELR